MTDRICAIIDICHFEAQQFEVPNICPQIPSDPLCPRSLLSEILIRIYEIWMSTDKLAIKLFMGISTLFCPSAILWNVSKESYRRLVLKGRIVKLEGRQKKREVITSYFCESIRLQLFILKTCCRWKSNVCCFFIFVRAVGCRYFPPKDYSLSPYYPITYHA